MRKSVLLSVALIAGGFALSATGADIPFLEPVDIGGGAVRGVSSMDAADITGNGLIDVAVIEGGKHADGRVTFAWFEATGKKSAPWLRRDFNPEAPLKSFLGSARLADIDGDGDPDLIVSSDNHSNAPRQADVLVFTNPRPRGDVRQSWPMTVVARNLALHHINDMEIADLDADGRLDIVVRSLEPNQIHLFFGDAGGWSAHKVIETELEQSEGLAVGDLNGDGLPEITFTGYLLRAPRRPRSQAYKRVPIDPDYHRVNQNTKEALGDLDGDGRDDLILAPAEHFRAGKPHALAWYCNPGGSLEAPWTQHSVVASINDLHTIKLGDINGDGTLDVVTGQPWGNLEVKVYYNDGAGGFPHQQSVVSGKGLYSGLLVDLEGDGDLDIVGQDGYARESRPWVYESTRVGGRR